jgi:predicted Zn finger-like uncharacterized protein
MFTRCPKCQTVFRISAAVLQMADGDVRCGSCSEVFNALQTLVDDWSGTGLPAATVMPPVESDKRPADDFEFNVPEDEWQRFFISPTGAQPPRPEPALGGDFDRLAVGAAPDDPAPSEAPPAPRSIEDETADTDTWQSFLREAVIRNDPPEQPADPPPEPGASTAPEDLAPEDLAPKDPVPAGNEPAEETREMPAWPAVAVEPIAPADGGDAIDSAVVTPEVATVAETAEMAAAPDTDAEEPVGDTVLDWGPHFSEREAPAPSNAGRWLAASLLAALALGAQAVHHMRDQLAVDAMWGGAVRDGYRRIGQTLYPAWPLAAYEVRDMKAIADNTTPGGLDIVAEIAVDGDAPVGLPVLRVTLRDRWSNPVSSGSFVAAEYLAERAPADRLYSPGSLIPVQLTLKDPGTTAQGYELDVCMPNRQYGLLCRNLRDPFRR